MTMRSPFRVSRWFFYKLVAKLAVQSAVNALRSLVMRAVPGSYSAECAVCGVRCYVAHAYDRGWSYGRWVDARSVWRCDHCSDVWTDRRAWS